MSKSFRPYGPTSGCCRPAPSGVLPDDHLAYFIPGVVEQLETTARCEQESRCGPPDNPRTMVNALLCSYRTEVTSSRRITQRLLEEHRLPGDGGE